jgi:hypothetical protein
VYVPHAEQLTGGGFFYKSKAHPGLWDTAESAQLLLRNLLAAHRAALKALPARLDAERAADDDGRPAAGAVEDAAAPAAAEGGAGAGAGGRDWGDFEEGGEGGGGAAAAPDRAQGPTVAQARRAPFAPRLARRPGARDNSQWLCPGLRCAVATRGKPVGSAPHALQGTASSTELVPGGRRALHSIEPWAGPHLGR